MTTAKKPRPAGKGPAARAAKVPAKARKGAQPARGPTRGEELLAMLSRPEGVSIAEMMKAFGVQPHSARAMISVLGSKRGTKATLENGRYKL